MGRISRIDQDKDSFERVVAESFSVAEVARKLEYKPSGGIHKFLERKFDEYSLDTNHFKGNGWNKGLTREQHPGLDKMAQQVERTWKELFRKGSVVKNEILIRRLVNAGKKYSCDECGISRWNSKPMRLQLEHNNGDNTDNRQRNLLFLCPNCHSQTETFSRGTKPKRDTYENRWWKRMSLEA